MSVLVEFQAKEPLELELRVAGGGRSLIVSRCGREAGSWRLKTVKAGGAVLRFAVYNKEVCNRYTC
jgi:hypothetical protein